MRKKQRLMLVSKENGHPVKSIYANPSRKGYVRYLITIALVTAHVDQINYICILKFAPIKVCFYV